MTDKELLGIIALIISIIGYIPYIRGIFRGKTHPHAFSWLIWGLITGIAFAAQVSDRGGAGTWSTGLSAFLCLLIFVLALKKGEKDITITDWISLAFGLLAIPLWAITKSPFWSVILITVVDLIGYYPTFRKTYIKPHSENLSMYILGSLKFVVSLFALTNFSFITAFYPLVIVAANIIFIFMVVWRRQILTKK
ncbi:MAG: hypothetical protein Q8P68_04015 [Candidatus Peregrinibacteria bacterium]|nr:hypothetical protein [Candidatus Peregrinibacteria bacterium]MDZ4245300.1 hypothetical protein [Candidatus Gracilibacteria bacterium]